MKRHAFLLLCHDEPEHTELLLEALTTHDVHFFIHVDAKVELSSFSQLLTRNDVTWVDSRVKVHWGGWSVVQATLNALDQALQSGMDFEYFTLLSGTHFPLRDKSDVFQYFDRHDAEHINITSVPNFEMNKTLERFNRFYLEGGHRPIGLWMKLLNKVHRLIRKFPIRNPERRLAPWRLYAGSGWWTLSKGAARLIQRTIREQPHVIRFFRYVHIPDESFFQTILGNNGYLERCRRSPIYTDWSNPKEAPCFITREHLSSILDPNFELDGPYGKSPVIFARKFGIRNRDVVRIILDRFASERSKADPDLPI